VHRFHPDVPNREARLPNPSRRQSLHAPSGSTKSPRGSQKVEPYRRPSRPALALEDTSQVRLAHPSLWSRVAPVQAPSETQAPAGRGPGSESARTGVQGPSVGAGLPLGSPIGGRRGFQL